MLDFEPGIASAKIKHQEIVNGAEFILTELTLEDGSTMDVAFVHHPGADWLFTPWDWQGIQPQSAEDIGIIDWRVNATHQKGIIFGGIPRLAPWSDDPKDVTREQRKSIGAKIREARVAGGWTTRQLAEYSGVPQSAVVRIENGRLNAQIDTFTKLAHTLGLTITLE